MKVLFQAKYSRRTARGRGPKKDRERDPGKRDRSSDCKSNNRCLCFFFLGCLRRGNKRKVEREREQDTLRLCPQAFHAIRITRTSRRCGLRAQMSGTIKLEGHGTMEQYAAATPATIGHLEVGFIYFIFIRNRSSPV